MTARIGRPPLAPAQKRTQVVKVKLTMKERAALVKLARATGLDLSEVVRQALTLVQAEAAATP